MIKAEVFPKFISKVKIPPIKCQGIKTHLVPFILQNISWNGNGTWFEPFLGSGVVLFNARPKKAIVSDINHHIIHFYREIQRGKITKSVVRAYLEKNGKKLQQNGESYYYEVRDRFNNEGNPLDFLFLSRSCFNGMMRFNQSGRFNVPFCKKRDRFRPAYITKIVNQVGWVVDILKAHDWIFQAQDWKKVLEQMTKNDFAYIDPPYLGRHTGYFNKWTEKDDNELIEWAKSIEGGFAISTWKENIYRQNTRLEIHWKDYIIRTFSHFYHVGPTESLRHKMEECLIIKPGYESDISSKKQSTTLIREQ